MSEHSESALRRAAAVRSLRMNRLDLLANPYALLLAGVAVIGGSLLAYQALERHDAPRRLATIDAPLATPAPTPIVAAPRATEGYMPVPQPQSRPAAPADIAELPTVGVPPVETREMESPRFVGPLAGLPLERLPPGGSLLDPLLDRAWVFGAQLFSANPAEPEAPASTPLDDATQAALPVVPEPASVIRPIAVGRGDTLTRVLQRGGVPEEQAYLAATALADVFNPRRLQLGQEITLTFTRSETGGLVLSQVQLADGVERTVGVTRQAEGFSSYETTVQLDRAPARVTAKITDSLYQAALDAGLPMPALSELIKLFSYDVDFQREVQPGDSFDVLYESYTDDTGKIAKTGRILSAAMTLSGREQRYYLFQPQGEAEADYFNQKGQSVRKALLRTPIDGARLSSGFGRRTHPILGYSIMHKGVDFAAPTGTPIQAAGSGTIEKAGWNGGYGNYVRIRHTNGFSTAYAHMSRIAAKPGTAVRQGQVIGYVGSTGMSTGAHLHYEVLQNNQQVNPLSLRLPTGRNLEGRELKRFQTEMARLDDEADKTPARSWLASRN